MGSSLVPGDMSRVLAMRAQWASIAHDLVLMAQPQTTDASQRLNLPMLMGYYGLSEAEFSFLAAHDDFKKVFMKVLKRAEGLGHKAGFIMRAEIIASQLLEKLYERLHNGEEVADRDLIRGTELALQAAKLLNTKDQESSGPQVAIQINVPQLSNSKLEHLSVH